MPSFLSRIFGRKKADDKASKRVSNGSLLEGKFEAVSATPSPSATNFVEAAQARERERASQKDKEKEKDAGFTLFRSRSRPTSPPLTAQILTVYISTSMSMQDDEDGYILPVTHIIGGLTLSRANQTQSRPKLNVEPSYHAISGSASQYALYRIAALYTALKPALLPPYSS